MSTIISGDAANVSNNLTRSLSDATNASPIVCETTVSHLYADGDTVVVSGVVGNTAANGTWVIVVTDATHFQLVGSTGNGAYVSGGTVVDTALTPQFTIPSDGDVFNAAAFNVAFEALADRTQFLAQGMRMKHVRVTATGSLQLPDNCAPFVYMRSRGSGGGGGGGGRGNSADADSVYSLGGAGGGAGELIEGWVQVTPGDLLGIVIAAAGAGGAGSATVDGADGTVGGDVTVSSSTPTVLQKARGGTGGAGSVRNIDPNQIGAVMGGFSNRPQSVSLPNKIREGDSTAAASAAANTSLALAMMGPGCGNSQIFNNGAVPQGNHITNYVNWGTKTGLTSTDGAQGTNDGLKYGGGPGLGGGCTDEAVGGTGGNGGNAVAGGSGTAGSAGAAPAASALGCGGGGGGSGGTGTSGGVGANGAAGTDGYVDIYYFGAFI